VLSLASVGAAFGWRQGIVYLVGLFIGTDFVCLVVISGLAAIVLAYPVIRSTLLVISAAYLAFLALRIALAGVKVWRRL